MSTTGTRRAAQMITCGAITLLVPVAADAAVFTYAQNGDQGSQIFAGYNYDTQDNYNYYMAPVGAKTYGGCAPSATACSATHDGTPGANSSQNSSYNRTSLSDTDAGGPSSGFSFARADLTAAQLGVSVNGSQRTKYGDSGDGVGGNAAAAMADGLNFLVLGAGASTVTNISVNLALHGTFSVPNQYIFSNLLNSLTFGNASMSTTDKFDVTPNQHTASGWVNYSFSPDTGGNIVFSGTYALMGPSQHVDFFEKLTTHSGNGEATDFGHTADFSLTLPSNVTFTSDSGAFLTASQPGPGSATPEPSSWAMMLLGFGSIGFGMRRRRQNDALRFETS